jgi:hypothetical protein
MELRNSGDFRRLLLLRRRCVELLLLDLDLRLDRRLRDLLERRLLCPLDRERDLLRPLDRERLRLERDRDLDLRLLLLRCLLPSRSVMPLSGLMNAVVRRSSLTCRLSMLLPPMPGVKPGTSGSPSMT